MFNKKEYDKIYSRRYRREHPEWKKESNKKCAETIKRLVKEWQKKHPEACRAKRMLNNAIKRGDIKRQPCVVCGKEKGHGHHEDYSKPLEVLWLCPEHHKAIHYNLLTINLKTYDKNTTTG